MEKNSHMRSIYCDQLTKSVESMISIDLQCFQLHEVAALKFIFFWNFNFRYSRAEFKWKLEACHIAPQQKIIKIFRKLRILIRRTKNPSKYQIIWCNIVNTITNIYFILCDGVVCLFLSLTCKKIHFYSR